MRLSISQKNSNQTQTSKTLESNCFRYTVYVSRLSISLKISNHIQIRSKNKLLLQIVFEIRLWIIAHINTFLRPAIGHWRKHIKVNCFYEIAIGIKISNCFKKCTKNSIKNTRCQHSFDISGRPFVTEGSQFRCCQSS